jgi:hypothetical protein
MLSAKKFSIIFIGLIFFGIMLYYILFFIQIGKTHFGTFWVKNVYQYKEYLAKKTQGRKIIVIAGSNGLFGINSSILSSEFGIDVINLSSHVSLDLDFYYFMLEKYIKNGDIVIMPLEFVYYKQERFNDFHINNMMAWGQKDYLDHLNIYEYIQFIMSIPKERIFKGLYYIENKSESYKDESTIVKEVNFVNDYGVPNKWRQYSHKSLNKSGNFNIDATPTDDLLRLYDEGIEYYDINTEISSKFIKSFYKIQKLVDSHNGRLILTWPVTIKNKKFDLSQEKYINYTLSFKNRLKKEGINIQCNPASFNMDVDNFFDTIYHLNLRGANKNTSNLASCMKEIIHTNEK